MFSSLNGSYIFFCNVAIRAYNYLSWKSIMFCKYYYSVHDPSVIAGIQTCRDIRRIILGILSYKSTECRCERWKPQTDKSARWTDRSELADNSHSGLRRPWIFQRRRKLSSLTVEWAPEDHRWEYRKNRRQTFIRKLPKANIVFLRSLNVL